MSKPDNASLMLVLKLVDQMRRAQKDYFLHRNKFTLNKAKELERRVDYHLNQTFLKYGYPIGSIPTKQTIKNE